MIDTVSSYRKEIDRLRLRNSNLENLLSDIYFSKAWQFIMFIRLKLLDKFRTPKNEKKPYLPQPSKQGNSRKKKGPLVSVIIPCYNYGSYIKDAIDSIQSQTYTNIEIIVIDDGSTDTYTKHMLTELKNVHIIHQRNQGLPATRNNGIKKAKGKYICCLDADDKIVPSYIKECVEKMEKEKLDLCGSYYQTFGDSYIREDLNNLNPTLSQMLQKNYFHVSSVFTKKIWQKVHGYSIDRQLHGCEDWDFWIKILEKKGECANIPKYLFLYRKHGTSMVNNLIENLKVRFEYLKNKHKNFKILATQKK